MFRKTLRDRLPWALGSYALLGAAVSFTLEGHLRWFLYLLLAAMALKSWIAVKREEQQK